jgi:TonB family protein
VDTISLLRARRPALPIDAPTAFFSYSRDDSEFALRLAEDLKAAGAYVWLDQLDIQPGQRWARAVQDALSNSPRLLVILSPSSVNSNNVEDEVTFALEEHKTVIPVFYRDCKVPFQLRPFQYVDFRTDYARGLKVMLKTLGVEQQAVAETAAAAATPVESKPSVPDAEAAAARALMEQAAAKARRELEQERRQTAEPALLEEQRRQAAEQARLEEESRQAAAEKARLDQEEHERKVAAENVCLEQEERERQASAEEARLEQEERERLAAEQVRLEEERKHAAAEKSRLEQEERERLAAVAKARQEQEERERLAAAEKARQEQRQHEPLEQEHDRGPKPSAVPSPLHRLPAWMKVAVAVCGILVVILVSFWAFVPRQPESTTQKPEVKTETSSTPPPAETSSSKPAGEPQSNESKTGSVQNPLANPLPTTKEPNAIAASASKNKSEASKDGTGIGSAGALSSKAAAVSNARTPQRIQVSKGVSQGLLVYKVLPVYPPLARQAHISGTVVLDALIGKDGTIQTLTVVTGHPMLIDAAMDAVKQWRYKPYYVKGQPREVETTIDVIFALVSH